MEALAPLQGVFSHQYQQLIDRSRYVYVEANIYAVGYVYDLDFDLVIFLLLFFYPLIFYRYILLLSFR